ncbi:hypothetical protein ABZP36_021241 [Zizania latifolia]
MLAPSSPEPSPLPNWEVRPLLLGPFRRIDLGGGRPAAFHGHGGCSAGSARPGGRHPLAAPLRLQEEACVVRAKLLMKILKQVQGALRKKLSWHMLLLSAQKGVFLLFRYKLRGQNYYKLHEKFADKLLFHSSYKSSRLTSYSHSTIHLTSIQPENEEQEKDEIKVMCKPTMFLLVPCIL